MSLFEISESDKKNSVNSDACKFDAEGEKDKSNFDVRPDRLWDHFTLWNIPRRSPHSPPLKTLKDHCYSPFPPA